MMVLIKLTIIRCTLPAHPPTVESARESNQTRVKRPRHLVGHFGAFLAIRVSIIHVISRRDTSGEGFRQ